jgi:outer membrane protein assembly factor BamB
LDDKPPSEWSEAEVELLRTRVRDSDAVRAAVWNAVRFDQQLAERMAEWSLSADKLMAAARKVDPARRRLALWGWTTGLVLLLCAVGAGWFAWNSRKDNDPRNRELVADKPGTGEAAAPTDATTPSTSRPVSESSAADANVGPTPSPPQAVATSPEGQPATVATTEKPGAAPTVPPKADERTSPADPLGEWPELAHSAPVVAGFEPDLEPAGLGKSELQRWLEGVPGEHHKFNETTRHEVRVAAFDGLVKLRAPWGEDSGLRMASFDDHGLAMYFWRGDEGVAVLHYPPRARLELAAYVVKRIPGQRRPDSWVLASTDDGKYERLARPPVDVRFQDGQIVVQRGPVRLLSAPLSGSPQEVYFERKGDLWLRSFRMYRTAPFANPVVSPAEILTTFERPVDLDWTTRLTERAYWYPNLEGPVELKSEKVDRLARADFPLPTDRLSEIVVEVRSPTPGTGVYLANDKAEPLCQLGFFEERDKKRTVWGLLPIGAAHDHANIDVAKAVAPYVAERQWFKLIHGFGIFKAWSSLDGHTWTRLADAPLGVSRGRATRLGLYCLPGAARRSITLGRVEVRGFGPLFKLGGDGDREAVPASLTEFDGDYAGWLARALDSQPAGVPLDAWLARAAVACLERGPRSLLLNEVLHGLLDSAVSRGLPLAEMLPALEVGAELLHSWDYGQSMRHATLYHKLGFEAGRRGDARPYQAIALPLLETPLWTEANFDAMPVGLVREELIGAIARDDWAAVNECGRRVEFWNESGLPEYRYEYQRPGLRPLVTWALAAAARELPGVVGPRTVGPDPRRRGGKRGGGSFLSTWRHPLVTELSKEGFNTLAEVRVALAEGSLADACQIISSAKPELALGLLPDARDPKLLLSLPQAVELAMREDSRLQEAMIRDFGPLGRLRVMQAMREGSEVAVRAATVQFHGTEAAAGARVWLGDRALALGDFSQAAREYAHALRQAPSRMTSSVEARQRLANAYLGKSIGSPATAPVALGAPASSVMESAEGAGTRRESVRLVPAAEFEALLASIRERSTRAIAPGLTAEPQATIDPEPGPAKAYEAHVRSRWQGEMGHAAGNPANGLVDWTARQLAVEKVDQTLYITNRFQVAAMDLANGQMRWTQGLGAEIGHAHRFPLMRMKPVVAGDRLFVRRLTKDGPQLACLKTADGSVLWQIRPPDAVLSDPVWTDGQLLALVGAQTSDGSQQISLAEFDVLTGDVRERHPVMRVQDGWDRQIPCAMTLAPGRRLLALVGGSVACFETSGQPLWVRRQTWLPLAQDNTFYEQAVEPPAISPDGLVACVMQLGVPFVECVEVDTGRRKWVAGAVDPRRMHGWVSGRFVVETAKEMVALGMDDGAVAWRVDGQMSGIVAAGSTWLDARRPDGHAAQGNVLVLARREQLQPDVARPVLVRIDAANGRELSSTPLAALVDKDPQFGPLVPHGDRWWAFFGKGQREPSRDIVELLPTAELPSDHVAPLPELAGWRGVPIDPRLHHGVGAVLPGWFCVQGLFDGNSGFRRDSQGQKELAGIVARKDRPAVLAGGWPLDPQGARPLRFRAGFEGDNKWVLRVKVAGHTVAQELVDASTTSNGWREIVVSPPAPVLANYARSGGDQRIVAVVLEAVPAEKDQAVTLWGR